MATAPNRGAGRRSPWPLPSLASPSLRAALAHLAQRGRRRRPGGSWPPGLSVSAGSSPTMVQRVRTYTGCSLAGPSRVVRARLGLPPDPNRTTAPIGCGSGPEPATAMAGQPGTHGTDAEPAILDQRAEAAYQRGWNDGVDYATDSEW